MTTDSFEWHSNALKGVRGPIFDGEPMSGWYENRRKNKNTGKTERNLVAYWKDSHDGSQRCHLNGRDVDNDTAQTMWPFASKRPIPADIYHAVMAGAPWPDSADSVNAHAEAEDDGSDPMAALVKEIAKAKADIPNYAKIESDDQLVKAQSLRSLLTTLAGKLDKMREALVRPHIDAQREVNSAWNPIIADAKDAAAKVRAPMEAWESFKREQARKAHAEEERKQREFEAAARKAEEAGKPAPPPPAAVVPNAPPPVAKIAGGGGRAASVSVWNEVIIDDEAAVYAYLKGNADLTALILKLAQKASDAGLKVPGTHTDERTKIR